MTASEILETEEIRFVLPFPSIFYATIFLAESQGFFAGVGLRSRVAYAERGGDPVEGLIGGIGEIAVGGVVRLMRLPKDETQKFAIIGQINGASGFSILGRRPGPFQWTDMRSRKFIPFAESRTPWLFTQSVLSRHRVDPEQMHFMPAANTDEAVLFAFPWPKFLGICRSVSLLLPATFCSPMRIVSTARSKQSGEPSIGFTDRRRSS